MRGGTSIDLQLAIKENASAIRAINPNLIPLKVDSYFKNFLSTHLSNFLNNSIDFTILIFCPIDYRPVFSYWTGCLGPTGYYLIGLVTIAICATETPFVAVELFPYIPGKGHSGFFVEDR